MVKPTDTSNAEYFHKVVDCQYACPAHTPVPQYIRLISEERFTEAYLVNRESNVFPGILGRICDRPCEPACRRSRVDEEPVAICRLKRAAADFKDADYRKFLPVIPTVKNQKKVALIGAGPASLTVANDLQPLGYTCTLFEKSYKAGGAIAQQVPAFRLPEAVLEEEVGNILAMGVETNYGCEVKSLKGLLDAGYDAIFIGSGAPLGKDLHIPGRTEAGAFIHIGLQFLANIAFEHLKRLEKNVVVIGGGNTAMDCARSARRLGAKSVTVIAPESYNEMLASNWEKQDAMHEGILFHNLLLPKKFTVGEDGTLRGVWFSPLESCYDKNKQFNPVFTGKEDVFFSCEEVILAIGQSLSFSYVEPDLIERDASGNRFLVNRLTMQTSNSRVFIGGDAAFGPCNMITSIAHGHAAAISIHLHCQNKDVSKRPKRLMELISQKMAINLWAYDNRYDLYNRAKMPECSLSERFLNLKTEVELGFGKELVRKECARCLNCDVQTVFKADACIECDACIDICPSDCLTITEAKNSEAELIPLLKSPYLNPEQSLFYDVVPQTKRLMVKDENICLHCGLCAERCPTGAWDMQAFSLKIPKARDCL